MRDVEAGFFHGGEHGFGRRRGGRKEFDDMGQRLFFGGGRVDQRRHDNRRAAQMRHFVRRDCVIHRRRADRAQAHMRAGGDRN